MRTGREEGGCLHTNDEDSDPRVGKWLVLVGPLLPGTQTLSVWRLDIWRSDGIFGTLCTSASSLRP